MNLRSFRPAYLLRRLSRFHFERRHPHAPWLAESAVLLLDSYLKPTDVGLEWGSGRSTLWFAARVAHLYSIEDDPIWYQRVRQQLDTSNLAAKVTHRFVGCLHEELDEPVQHPYADAAHSIQDGSLDFALVDGNIRSTCMHNALAKIKPGGLLALDNANRFFPNCYGSKNTTVHEPRHQPLSKAWSQLMEELKDWRWIHTTDGIWDTRFWIKPLTKDHPIQRDDFSGAMLELTSP